MTAIIILFGLFETTDSPMEFSMQLKRSKDHG